MTRDRPRPPLDADGRARVDRHADDATALARDYRAGRPGRSEDYRGEALLALCEAARDYRPSRHGGFPGFARSRVLAALAAFGRAEADARRTRTLARLGADPWPTLGPTTCSA